MKEGKWEAEKDGAVPSKLEFLHGEKVLFLRERNHTVEPIAEEKLAKSPCEGGDVGPDGGIKDAVILIDGSGYCEEHGEKAIQLLFAAERQVKGNFRQQQKNPTEWN